MLTNQEMQETAEHYISFDTDVEMIIYNQSTIEKTYGSIYFHNSKRYAETGDFKYHILATTPFLVEKETGRVVNFGTAYPLEHYIKAYEEGTLEPSLDRYWYPDEERFSHK